jgi:hypothetical protein
LAPQSGALLVKPPVAEGSAAAESLQTEVVVVVADPVTLQPTTDSQAPVTVTVVVGALEIVLLQILEVSV